MQPGACQGSQLPRWDSPGHVSSLPWPLRRPRHPPHGDPSSGQPTVTGSKKMCPQDPGGTRLCICRAVSVTRSEERFGLTNLFQNTCLLLLLLLLFAFVLLLLLGLLSRERI